MIRFILVAAFVVLFLIISIPMLFIEWIIGKFNKRVKDISSLRYIQGAFKIILWMTGVDITVIGAENVPKDQPVLYVGNHRSFFDVVITYSRCPDLTGYISKKEFEKIPLLSNWMKYLHCLFVDRDDIRDGMKMILAGIEKVKTGISICIFPEGTRNKGEELILPFKEGSMKIAEKTGCPIIPMALNNTADIFEDHFPKIKKTHVIVEYGTPIYPDQLDKKEKKFLGAHCNKIITEMILKNEPDV